MEIKKEKFIDRLLIHILPEKSNPETKEEEEFWRGYQECFEDTVKYVLPRSLEKISLIDKSKWELLKEHIEKFPEKTHYSHEYFESEELTPEMIDNRFFNAHSYVRDVFDWFEELKEIME